MMMVSEWPVNAQVIGLVWASLAEEIERQEREDNEKCPEPEARGRRLAAARPPLPVRPPGGTNPPPVPPAPPQQRLRLPAETVPTIWLATPDGMVSIDTVAVRRAVAGDRRGWKLTDDEAQYTAEILFSHDVSLSVVAARVGRTPGLVRSWLPGSAPVGTGKPVAHGTSAGYSQHVRAGEKACTECKAAEAKYRADRRTARTAQVSGVAA
ncbi:hypothetical protein ACFRK5_36155 [Streptomyces niveus]|uniref:hypothetical protein n=1 Tax=Streptomyces niveus TaxID=193462 RepID=UPI003675ED8F